MLADPVRQIESRRAIPAILKIAILAQNLVESAVLVYAEEHREFGAKAWVSDGPRIQHKHGDGNHRERNNVLTKARFRREFRQNGYRSTWLRRRCCQCLFEI